MKNEVSFFLKQLNLYGFDITMGCILSGLICIARKRRDKPQNSAKLWQKLNELQNDSQSETERRNGRGLKEGIYKKYIYYVEWICIFISQIFLKFLSIITQS